MNYNFISSIMEFLYSSPLILEPKKKENIKLDLEFLYIHLN